jgi:hypothetical protein
MNTGNWKTATSGRDRKKRSDKQPVHGKVIPDMGVATRRATKDEIVSLSRSHFDPTAPNPFEVIADASITQKQTLKRTDPFGETWTQAKDVFTSSTGAVIVLDVPTSRSSLTKPLDVSETRPHDASLKDALRASTRPQWGDQSEDDMPEVRSVDDRFEPMLRMFTADLNGACGSFEAELEYISGFAAAIINRGMELIKDRKREVEKNSPSEKELVNDLHAICTHGTQFISGVEECTKSVAAIVNECETKKNTTLDELKNFLLGMTNTNPLDLTKHASVSSSERVADASNNAPPRVSSQYSAIVARDDAPVRKIDARSVSSLDMASVPLGIANLAVPLARQKSDVQPMSIKFAANLGVFLINLDGTTYSFCNGVFVSRPNNKTNDPKLKADNTLYGKRCNPWIARCVGAECTYYHDPLTHTPGHTSRNMGVHYVVSELISGVSTDADIIETARGRNKYIVEDIVQLAGMLLIKAFLVKKAREDRRSLADNADA